MNTMKRWFVGALVMPATLAFAQDKSAAPILPDSHGTVVIGDVRGLLDKVGALASKVMDGMDASAIRQQAGMMIGDPTLSGFPAGSGIAVVVPKEGMPCAFLEVAPEKLSSYQELMKQRKMGVTAEAEGLLLLAADEAGIESAKKLAGQVKSNVLGGSGSPTVTGSIKLAEILKKYDAQIQSGIESIAEKVDQADSATTAAANVSAEGIEGIFRGYYAVAKRIDTLEVSLAPSAEGMTITKDITLVNKSVGANRPSGEEAAKLIKQLPATGAMRGYAAFDFGGLAKFMGDIMAEVTSEAGAATVDVQAMTAWFEQMKTVFNGAMAMNFMSDLDSPFAGSFLCGVTDEAGALKFLNELPAKLEQVGFNKLYAAMGMPVETKFEEKVGTYKDIPLHRLTMKMSFERGTEEQKEKMKQIMGNMVYDVAIVNKTLVYAVKPQKIEELIDAVQSGTHTASKPLASVSNLPAGGNGYFDYNIGTAMLVAFKMSPDAQGPGAEMMTRMAESVKDAPPMQFAWYEKDGAYRFSALMPAAMLKAFVAAGQQAFMAAQSKASVTDGDAEVTTTSATRRSNGAREGATRTSGPRPRRATNP